MNLEPRLVQAVQGISREYLHSVDVEVVANQIGRSMLVNLTRYVMAEKTDEKVHEWTEEPVWPNARAHYVSELPDGFRRRFLQHFWGLSDEDLKPRRRVHQVKVQRWTTFPDLPPTMGKQVHQQLLDEMSYWA